MLFVGRLLLLLMIELRDGRDDLRAGVLMMDARLQLLQRDELLRLLDRSRVQELGVTLCHVLRHHLALFQPGRGPTELQEIVQLRLRRRVPLLMRMLLMMIVEDAIVHAGAIADYRNVILDDAVSAVR